MIGFFLGAGLVGWLAGESIRRRRRVGDSRLGSGDRLGQEYVTDEELIEAQSAYEALVRDPSASAKDISEHYSLYRELYAQYQRELALRRELEQMAWNQDRDARDLGMDPGRDPKLNEAIMRRMKDRQARMEELWPGWYKLHLDWAVYRRTGGKPDWYIELEAKALSAVNLAIQLVPFFQGMRGGIRAPSPSIRPQPGSVIPTGPQPIYPFRPGDPLRRPLVVTPSPSAAPAPALLKPSPPAGTPGSVWQKPPPGVQMPTGMTARVNTKTGEVFYHVGDIERVMRQQGSLMPGQSAFPGPGKPSSDLPGPGWMELPPGGQKPPGVVEWMPTETGGILYRAVPPWLEKFPPELQRAMMRYAQNKGMLEKIYDPKVASTWTDIVSEYMASRGYPAAIIPAKVPLEAYKPPTPAGPAPVYPLPIGPVGPVVPDGRPPPFSPIPTGEGERRYRWGPTPLSQVMPPTTPTQRTLSVPFAPSGGGMTFTGV